MAAVFSMQGLGQLGGALVMLCLTAGFKDTLIQVSGTKTPKTTPYQNCTGDCAIAVDKMWRALIGIGTYIHTLLFHNADNFQVLFQLLLLSTTV